MTDTTAETRYASGSRIPSTTGHAPSGTFSDISSNLFSQRYLLMLRFALVNALGLVLSAEAWTEGLLDPVIASDTTHLCLVIFATFLVGMGMCGQRLWRISHELNLIKEFDPAVPSRVTRYVAEVRDRDSGARAIAASALKAKLSSRVSSARQVSSTLVVMGLIGTVVGFIIALSGVDPEKAGDVSAIGPMVSRLIEGMAVALYTTLVGSVLNVWLNVNVGMLSRATVSLLTETVALGERHART